MKMYIVVGHSDALSFIMSDYAIEEVARGINWFYYSLVAGIFLFFLVFWVIIERKLYYKVTVPIQELDKSIKNPKDFMAKHQKSYEDLAMKRNSTFRHLSAPPSKSNESTASNEHLDSSRSNAFSARDTDGFMVIENNRSRKNDYGLT